MSEKYINDGDTMNVCYVVVERWTEWKYNAKEEKKSDEEKGRLRS